jgi:eukaryotic translation initiation factor 2C
LNRSFFKLDTFRKQLGFNLDLWKGFFVSVRPSEMGFNVNIDVANTVFFDEGNLIDLAKKWYNCNENQLNQKMREDRYGEFENQIRNRKIKTHLGYTKRVEGFGPSSSEHKFKLPDGTTTTVQAYFASQKRPLKFPQLPCLKLGKENYTPMEFCTTVRTNVSKIDPKAQSDMIRETAVPAEQRKADIERIMNSLDLNRDPILQQYNINVELKMVELKGRILPAPDLEYGGQNKILSSREIGTQGSWRNTGRVFLNVTVKIDNWLVINYSRRTNPNDFLDSLIRVSSNHGIMMANPNYVDNFSNERDPNKAIKFIEDAYKKYGNPSFILAILPGTTDIYKALKTFGDLRYGVTTQAIDGNTIFKNSRGFDQLVSNICLKINPKLGGRNFRLSPRTEYVLFL